MSTGEWNPVVSEVSETGYHIDGVNVSAALRNTLMSDKMTNSNDAVMEIYSRLRPGDPPTLVPVETGTPDMVSESEKIPDEAVTFPSAITSPVNVPVPWVLTIYCLARISNRERSSG